MAFRPVFGLWHPRCRGFEAAQVLRREQYIPTLNPQNGGPVYVCLSVCLASRSRPGQHNVSRQTTKCHLEDKSLSHMEKLTISISKYNIYSMKHSVWGINRRRN